MSNDYAHYLIRNVSDLEIGKKYLQNANYSVLKYSAKLTKTFFICAMTWSTRDTVIF